MSARIRWTSWTPRPARRWPRPIEQDLGRVDVLVNNAGVTQVMPFAMIEEKDWDLVMDVNVKGMFLATKAFARGMIRRKSGQHRQPGLAGGHAGAGGAGALRHRQERGRRLHAVAGARTGPLQHPRQRRGARAC